MKLTVLVCAIILSFQIKAQDSVNLKLMFMGDIMQHGEQVKAALQQDGSYDYTPNYHYIKPLIQSADLAIGNLELTLAGPPYSGYPQFSAADNLAVALKEAGFDFLVTANNHSLDRRKQGLERTIDVLDSLKIPHTGTFKDSIQRSTSYPALIQQKGVRIALLNYTYGTNGIPVSSPNIVNLIDKEVIANDMIKAREMNPDLIIVFTHWGYEYRSLPNKSQTELTDLLFQWGANLVIGSHPHVLQPIEWRNSKQLVAYSLGNFISNQRKRYQNGGMVLEIDITKTDSTYISNAGYHLSYVHTTPSPAKQFHILTTSQFQYGGNITGLEGARENIDEFVSDSRSLFATNNLNVKEIRNYPFLAYQDTIKGFGGEWLVLKRKPRIPERIFQEEVIVQKKPKKATTKVIPPVPGWSVQVMATSQKSSEELPWKNLKIVKDAKSGLFKYQVGPWSSRKEAEQQLESIRSAGWADAFIVKNN